MNRLAMLTAILSATMILSGAAQAMDIIRFDQMRAQDRQAFMDFQSTAAETVLWQNGLWTSVAKVHHLFNDFSPGSDLSLGETELEGNLAIQRVRDAEQHIKNHDAPRLQVESALALTLLKNGVAMTPDFIKSVTQLTSTFHPKSPPH